MKLHPTPAQVTGCRASAGRGAAGARLRHQRLQLAEHVLAGRAAGHLRAARGRRRAHCTRQAPTCTDVQVGAQGMAPGLGINPIPNRDHMHWKREARAPHAAGPACTQPNLGGVSATA